MADAILRSGAQESTLDMIKLLRARGVDVSILTAAAADPTFLNDLKALEIETYTVPHTNVAGYPDLTVDGVTGIINSVDAIWICDETYLIARRIKKIRPDIPIIAHLRSYHINCPKFDAWFGMQETCMKPCSPTRIIRCKQLGNKYVNELGIASNLRTRTYQILDTVKGPMDFLRWPMINSVLGSIDGFVAVSHATKDLILTHLPQLRATPFTVVHNPVLVENYNSPITTKDGFSMLYASGGGVYKGPHVALHAARRLLNGGYDNFELALFGTSGVTWLEGLVRELNLSKHVKLLPRENVQVVHKFMAVASVVLMPSLWPEPLGRIPIEANKLGTPAIVSTRGGCPETVVDHVTGLVADPTETDFAEAMMQASRMNWDRTLIKHTAALNFDPDQAVDEFMRFLQSFVER